MSLTVSGGIYVDHAFVAFHHAQSLCLHITIPKRLNYNSLLMKLCARCCIGTVFTPKNRNVQLGDSRCDNTGSCVIGSLHRHLPPCFKTVYVSATHTFTTQTTAQCRLPCLLCVPLESCACCCRLQRGAAASCGRYAVAPVRFNIAPWALRAGLSLPAVAAAALQHMYTGAVAAPHPPRSLPLP